jgi:hypothetical protein
MNVELNISLRCNKKCWACNRLCNVYPYTKEDDVTIEQIKKFIEQAKVIPVNKVKVLGGEPLLHPQFKEIYNLLLQALKDGIIKALKIDTNHTIPFPKDLEIIPGVRLMGKSDEHKKHLPIIHPLDAGYITTAKPDCAMIKRCGFSLDAKGWLPCSAAIFIERLFHLGLYKDALPKEPWGLDILCRNCPFSLPQEWQNNNLYPLNKHPKEYDNPSGLYMSKLNGILRT